MNYAKKLGQKMVKARASARSGGMRGGFISTSAGQRHTGGIPAGVVPTKPAPTALSGSGGSRGRGGRASYTGPWKGASSGPAAPGSPMGFGKGYKQTYAESHVHGRPSGKLRRYRNKRTQAQYNASRVT